MILGTVARLVARQVAAEAVRRGTVGVGKRAVREVAWRAAGPDARRAAAGAASDTAETVAEAASVVAGTAATLARRAVVTGVAVATGIGAGIGDRVTRRWKEEDDAGAGGDARHGAWSDGGDDARDHVREDVRDGVRDGVRADPPGTRAGKEGADAPSGRSAGDTTMHDDTTHFGYRTVDKGTKASLVGDVFDSVAPSYDVMNDLMSFGIHRMWKRFAIEQTAARPGQRVLDIAGGTGDLALKLARRVGSGGQVLLADINAAMLRSGRERLVDAGVVGNVHYAQSDAEALPFADDTFDCVTIAFGLRNVTDKARALESMHRVLKPGGRLIVLEFSKPVLPLLARAYDAYSFTALPMMGKLVAGDADSYRYLAESIRMHPDQETLASMMGEAGFERVEHHNLTGGIVALHKGFKL